MARPKDPKLSVDLIVDTALGMAGSTGSFTIPELAKNLGVRPSSLYNHVSGRDEIIELIRRRLHEAMAVRVDVDADWRDTFRRIAVAQRDSLASHPWLIPLLATSPASLDASITTLENFAVVLSRAGFDDANVLHVMATLDILTIGASLDYASPENLYPPEVLAQAPTLARATRSAPSTRKRADAAFGFVLDLVVEGLETRLRR